MKSVLILLWSIPLNKIMQFQNDDDDFQKMRKLIKKTCDFKK